MGPGRIPRDGNFADGDARVVLGDFAAGLCLWLSAGGSCLLGGVSVLRLARPLRGGRSAGIPCHFHPCTGAGIAGMATSPHRAD